MATLSMLGESSVVETKEYIKSKSQENGLSYECKDEVTHLVDGVGTCLIVFEKYFMRTRSYASLSVSITGDEQSVYVDAIAAGGGGGRFNFSYGSESNFLASLKGILYQKGFQEVEVK